ncbi:MAG: VWA domain-containing protein, partial [Flavobacteriaceae bacterium]|nr:VWA domain-containing protein [Flavobacteriaceae bacterium]
EITLVLSTLPNERNQANNRRTVVLEVVDERTEIALVSELMHPDLGALVKVIESNEQRSVTILKPDADPQLLEEKDLLILYQPTARFRGLYEWMRNKKPNRMTITGPVTDWYFLNNAQDNFQKEVFDETENAVPVLNAGFDKFDISDFEIGNYPPLDVNLGDILITKPHEVLLGQKIRGIDIEEPLLAVITNEQEREAVLFGEHIWKWRMQDFRNNNSFENFDQFINKVLRYLTDNASRERLTLDYKNLFEGNSRAKIRASFFDEAYIFDSGADLLLRINEIGMDESTEMPLLLKGAFYEADLSNLEAGEYEFSVTVKGEPYSKSGRFTIMEYAIEDQLISTNYNKLGRLSERSGGAMFFPAQTDSLLRLLQRNPGFSPVLKSEQNVVSLIEFAWLLAILAASLASEWFIRKYNGLI